MELTSYEWVLAMPSDEYFILRRIISRIKGVWNRDEFIVPLYGDEYKAFEQIHKRLMDAEKLRGDKRDWITVIEFAEKHKCEMSVRLYNILRFYGDDYARVTDVTANDFLKQRNAGITSLREFIELRDKILIIKQL